MKKYLVPLIILIFLLSGCIDTDYTGMNYIVTFDSNGGTVVESEEVKIEHQINIPAEPTRENYIFSGWFSDDKLTELYGFEGLVYSDMTYMRNGFMMELLNLMEILI